MQVTYKAASIIQSNVRRWLARRTLKKTSSMSYIKECKHNVIVVRKYSHFSDNNLIPRKKSNAGEKIVLRGQREKDIIRKLDSAPCRNFNLWRLLVKS